MKKMLILLSLIAAHSALAADATTETWTCQPAASAKAKTTLTGFQLQIQNGAKVAGGYVDTTAANRIDLTAGLNDRSWDFSSSPTVTQAAKGVIKFNAALDGWDHYSWQVAINPTTHTAAIQEQSDLDCAGPQPDGSDTFACTVSPDRR